jgi:peptide/nickel transport system ATP-binding protein
MYAGRKIEEAPVEALFAQPLHPYTRGLMAAMPTREAAASGEGGRLAEIPGVVPALGSVPKGCSFAPRCRHAVEACRRDVPPTETAQDGHLVACWRWQEILRLGGVA